MKKYDTSESPVADRLTACFISGFENAYRQLKGVGKGTIMEYLSQMFKKWYYSALIEDTVLTPACVNEYCGKSENVYPVLRTSSFQRLGKLETENIVYSIDDHPICSDIRLIVKAFEGGMLLDDDLYMSQEDIKKLKGISMNDKSYILYLVMLATDMGFIEKMPSVGVNMFCTTEEADELDEIYDDDLLYLLFIKAADIASSFLSDNFLGEDFYVSHENILEWLENPEPVDKIFEKAYGDIALDITDSFAMEDMSDVESELTAKAYARGVSFDKWFLTPFCYYFRFIDMTYMYEFSFRDEITYFFNACAINKEFKDESIMDSVIYSPCTLYKLSRLGAEFFETEYNESVPHVFKNMEGEEILKAVTDRDADAINKIISLYEPDYDVFRLSFSRNGGNSGKKSFIIEAKPDTMLDVLSNYAITAIHPPTNMRKSYSFYKLPESPFTRYLPGFMTEKGPRSDEHSLSEFLEEGEEGYFELVMIGIDGSDIMYNYTIRLEKIIKNEKGRLYPFIIK